ncbi:MAG TPA: hypothetical protein VKY65_05785 [Alphaproteobacteria bacterium]|nr:hypothetical protein [Alphaproteobacteria bacterium]
MANDDDDASELLEEHPTDEDLSTRAEQAYLRYCREHQLTPVPVTITISRGENGQEVILNDVNQNVVTRFQVKDRYLRRVAPVALPD